VDKASYSDPKPAEVKTCEATDACPIINSWVAAAFPYCPGTCGTAESIQTCGVTCEGSDGSIAAAKSSTAVLLRSRLRRIPAPVLLNAKMQRTGLQMGLR
jgi:hypothetical protein